jgi:NTE family protein
LVLGGGGIAGYSFHAGALAALEARTGWDPRTAEVILGTSAGSSVGAVLRGAVPVGALVERILSVPADYEGMDRLRRISGRGESLIGGAVPLPASFGLVVRELARLHRTRPMRLVAGALPAGRLDTRVLGEQAEVLHPHGWPEGALWIPAVELATGEVTVFGRDTTSVDVAAAVEASCAIPGWFRPVEIAGRHYIDGGIRSLANADLLAGLDLDLVVAVSPLSLDRYSARSPLASLARACPARQLRRELAELRRAGIATLILEPDPAVSRAMGANPMDPTRMVPILVTAAMSMNERIDRIDRRDRQGRLETLRAAAASLPSPADVPYPL